jgi:polar amino acid transport system substrate-binding protein
MDRRRVLIATTGLLAGGCALPWRAGLPPNLRIGFANDQEPFAFMRAGGPAGIEADLAQEVELRTGSRFAWQPMHSSALIPALLDRTVDVIMGGIGLTQQRAAIIGFTEPYLRSGLMVLLRERDLARLGNPSRRIYELDVRIGVVRGTAGETFIARRLAGKTFRFDRTEDAVTALAKSEVDYVVQDPSTVWSIALGPEARDLGIVSVYDPLTDEPLAWAVRTRDAGLRERLSSQIEQLRRDGTVARIVSRWLRTRVTAVAP